MSSQQIGEGKYIISVDSSGAISQLSQFDAKAKQTGSSVNSSFLLGASGALNLAGGLRTLYGGFDAIEKVQTRVKKTNLEVSRAQEELNKLTTEGKKGTLDYEQALQRLEIAKDKNKQANDDLFKGNMDVVFSIAQIGVGMPAVIKALQGLTSVKKILTATTWAETFAFLANPIYAIPTAAAIATAVGLVATNTWGLRDAIFGTTEAIDENTKAMTGYENNIGSLGNTASSTTGQVNDLNNSLGILADTLKKNDLSAQVEAFQGKAFNTSLVIGSLTTVMDNMISSGGIDVLSLIQDDNRVVASANKVKSVLISLYSIVNGKAIPNDGLGPNITAPTTNGFIRLGAFRFPTNRPADSREQIGKFLSYSRTASGGRSVLGGQDFKLLGLGRLVGSDISHNDLDSIYGGVGLRTTTKRHRGNKNSPMDPLLAFSNYTGQASKTNNATLMSAAMSLVESEGLTLPNYYGYGVLDPGQPTRGGATHIDWERYSRDMDAVIAEAKRRKETRISDFMNRSGLSRSEVTTLQTTQQGMDDLYGIIDYRERLARASTGTG